MVGATYGDLRSRTAGERASAAGGARCFRRKRRRRAFSMATMRGARRRASVGGGLATSRGHRVRVPARGWRRRRTTVRGGKRGDGHEVSILIRLGDGDRAGARAFERLDDDHPAAATRAAARRRNVFGLDCRPRRARAGAQFSAAASACRARSMLSCANRAGEEAVVADAVEAAGQHVQEKAADELVRRRASWS